MTKPHLRSRALNNGLACWVCSSPGTESARGWSLRQAYFAWYASNIVAPPRYEVAA